MRHAVRQQRCGVPDRCVAAVETAEHIVRRIVGVNQPASTASKREKRRTRIVDEFSGVNLDSIAGRRAGKARAGREGKGAGRPNLDAAGRRQASVECGVCIPDADGNPTGIGFEARCRGGKAQIGIRDRSQRGGEIAERRGKIDVRRPHGRGAAIDIVDTAKLPVDGIDRNGGFVGEGRALDRIVRDIGEDARAVQRAGQCQHIVVAVGAAGARAGERPAADGIDRHAVERRRAARVRIDHSADRLWRHGILPLEIRIESVSRGPDCREVEAGQRIVVLQICCRQASRCRAAAVILANTCGKAAGVGIPISIADGAVGIVRSHHAAQRGRGTARYHAGGIGFVDFSIVVSDQAARSRNQTVRRIAWINDAGPDAHGAHRIGLVDVAAVVISADQAAHRVAVIAGYGAGGKRLFDAAVILTDQTTDPSVLSNSRCAADSKGLIDIAVIVVVADQATDIVIAADAARGVRTLNVVIVVTGQSADSHSIAGGDISRRIGVGDPSSRIEADKPADSGWIVVIIGGIAEIVAAGNVSGCVRVGDVGIIGVANKPTGRGVIAASNIARCVGTGDFAALAVADEPTHRSGICRDIARRIGAEDQAAPRGSDKSPHDLPAGDVAGRM